MKKLTCLSKIILLLFLITNFLSNKKKSLFISTCFEIKGIYVSNKSNNINIFINFSSSYLFIL